MGEPGGRGKRPAGGSVEEVAAVASGQPVDEGRRRDVRRPRESEDRPEVEPASPGEERAERHGGVGGPRGDDVLECRERRDQAVPRAGRQAPEGREEIAQGGGRSGSGTPRTPPPPPLPS